MLEIRSRLELGAMWLRWYVRRDDVSVAASFEGDYPNMRRLRVTEFCENRERFAGVNALKRETIEWYLRSFDANEIAFEGKSFRADGNWLIADGNHRAVALYVLDPPRFVARFAVVPPSPDDVRPGLA
jgi:hypothetical protein